jgi:ABC-type branched-subunit amino acid transport system substrate-binding protein
MVLIAFSSCKKKGTSGVSDKEIVVGITTPLSGPAALWGNTGLGAKAWADYVNSRGGVNGRMIKVILKDDGYNPARALANLKEMKGKIFAVVGLLGTAVVHTCRDFFPDNKILLINAYGNTRMWTKYPKEKLKYVFIAYPDYEDEAEYMTNYAFNRLGSKKFSIFYQNDDYGKLGLAGIEKAVKKLSGADLIGKISYEVTERALSAHALKLKKAGADTLLIYPSPTHGAIIMKEMAKVGYKPKVFASFPLGDPVMFLIAKQLWEGVHPAIAAQYSLPGADPIGDKIAAILKKQNPKISSDSFAVFGAASMMHFVEGLKRAGKNVTAESMIRGMESIKDWKPEGMGGPVTYSPTRHHGLNGIKMGKARNKKVRAISDFAIFKPHF